MKTKTYTPEQELSYRELIGSAWDVGFAHGLANHTLSEMMLSCERECGRTIPVDVWLTLFDGREAGLKERAALYARMDARPPAPYYPQSVDDLPL